MSSDNARQGESPRFGPILALWMALVVALRGVLWLTGAPESSMAEAVERGAARVESRSIGEVSDDLIRKAIQTQRQTLPFWETLARLGDFVAEPVVLALRALAAAILFSALAALMGRPVRFERALADCAALQGIWVLGLAVRVALTFALRRGDVETSLALALPPGHYPAPVFLALRQVDPFALLGWASLARGAWRRGEMGLGSSLAVCVPLAVAEAALRVGAGLVVGAGMRLDLVPK